LSELFNILGPVELLHDYVLYKSTVNWDTDCWLYFYFVLLVLNLMFPQSNCPPTKFVLSDVVVQQFGIAS